MASRSTRKLSSLPSGEIAALLQDRPRAELGAGIETGALFSQILRIADEFVPSEAGSVFVDDPRLLTRGPDGERSGELVFVACFGDTADQLVGRRLPATEGFVGRCYQTGEPVLSADAPSDQRFYAAFDDETKYRTRSLICVPIRLGERTCGVLELINRRDRPAYDDAELHLLEIFAGYISTSLVNVVEADRYRELAKRDDLTGLFNDRYFHQRLSEEVERAERTGSPLALVFLDLDHFKSVNDRHGHLVGSQTLREVGRILGRAVEKESAIAARYGGDEFVLVAPGRDLDGGIELARAVQSRLAHSVFRIEPHEESGVLLPAGTITASFGVASYHDLEFSSRLRRKDRKNEFIRQADSAMYRAKAAGKNRVLWLGARRERSAE